jgi:hypothetical protein
MLGSDYLSLLQERLRPNAGSTAREPTRFVRTSTCKRSHGQSHRHRRRGFGR